MPIRLLFVQNILSISTTSGNFSSPSQPPTICVSAAVSVLVSLPLSSSQLSSSGSGASRDRTGVDQSKS